LVGAEVSKGVSEIVTTIMLIMIVASVGIGILLYSMGYFSSVTSARELMYSQDINKLKEHFIIADVVLKDQSPVNVTVYNYGTIDVTISGLYVGGNQTTIIGGPIIVHPNKWNSTISLEKFNATQANFDYSVKVVSSLGNFYEDFYRG
jgi:flagellin-like protein